MRGMFVVIEGADICGKSTQVDMLVARLRNISLPAVGMSFPRYDTPTGNAIKKHLKGEIWTSQWKSNPEPFPVSSAGSERAEKEDALVCQALQTMDKFEAVKDIQHSLSTGSVVVSSRWWQSMLIYGCDLGLDRQTIIDTCLVLPQANLNILLNVSEEQALKWRPEARDRYERDREKQKRIRQGYFRLWKDYERSCNWAVIYGEGSPLEVHERIFAAFVHSCVDKLTNG